MDINNEVDEVGVVMVPLQAHGHLNQLLQFACLISSYGLPVYYVGLGPYNQRARDRANALNPSDLAKIRFHDLPTPPDFETTTTTTTPLPPGVPDELMSKLPTLWHPCMHMREDIGSFIRDISSKARRVVVVHDAAMSYNVQDVSSIPNAESYIFHTMPCFIMYNCCMSGAAAAGFDLPIPKIRLEGQPSSEGCYPDDVVTLGAFQSKYVGISSGDIYNSSQLIEGATPFFDLMEQLASMQSKKLWAIGPILPTKPPNHISDCNSNDCLDWLDKQPPKSVLYVSFGTSSSFSDEQIRELARGLEQSKQKFIWVLRYANKGDIFTGESRQVELPDGFEERVKGVGLVVREWAPQPGILAHGSTGGFMSHCGWNSCIESITMGVPIAAWPMHSDQPENAFLVTELLKIGVIVGKWEQHKELVTASTIENVVRKLMASEEGDEIRKRAQQLGEAVTLSTEKGGASRMQLESFIAHITR